MKIELDKQYGPALVNYLRQCTMTSVPVVKPIAFAVGTNSNVLETSDSVIEDMTTFIHNVMCSNYYLVDTTGTLDKPILFEMTVSTNLKTSDFNSVKVYSKEDSVLLHALSETPVKIYFRNACGKYSVKQNLQFLQDAGVNTNDIVVVPSRHCAVDSFTVNEIENEDKFVCEIDVKSQIASKDNIYKYALEKVQEGVTELSKLLSNS